MEGDVTHMEKRERCVWSFDGETWSNHLEDLGMDGSIILRWIIKKLDIRAWN